MRQCPVCHGAVSKEAWRYKEYTILHCDVCDIEFESAMKVASHDYYLEHSKPVIEDERLYDDIGDDYNPEGYYTIHRIRDAANRYLSAHQRRVIDIGCGTGYFSVDLKRRGFDCLGIDFNPFLVQVAGERFGIQARVARLEELSNLEARYDFEFWPDRQTAQEAVHLASEVRRLVLGAVPQNARP